MARYPLESPHSSDALPPGNYDWMSGQGLKALVPRMVTLGFHNLLEIIIPSSDKRRYKRGVLQGLTTFLERPWKRPCEEQERVVDADGKAKSHASRYWKCSPNIYLPSNITSLSRPLVGAGLDSTKSPAPGTRRRPHGTHRISHPEWRRLALHQG
jgi:hypothetical protein